MNTQDSTLNVGDRVEITAAQSYEITWDDNGDRIVGEYGVLLEVNASALADNAQTGTYDLTPYKVRLDNDEEVWAADVMSEADGLRRTIAGLDKSLDDRWKRIHDLETRLAEMQAELAARPSTDEVAGWLLKKAREYPSAPERQESVPDAFARLASKVQRGAIRPTA